MTDKYQNADSLAKSDVQEQTVSQRVAQAATELQSKPKQYKKKKKGLRANISDGFRKKVKQVPIYIWGTDLDHFNTIKNTGCCVNFLTMQIIRMISLLALFCCLCLYFYIYVRLAFANYGFYALLFTFLAFAFLFIGSGKQVVYQQLVKTGKINYDDPKKRSNLWRKGVFFYAQAIPMVAVTNFIYWIPIKEIFGLLPDDFRDKYDWAKINNQGVRDDINEWLQILYARKYLGNDESDDDHDNDDVDFANVNKNGWRQNFIMWAQLIPAICLCLDMFLNKIRIRWQHVQFQFVILIFYFMMTYFFQNMTTLPTYIDNLNWTGDINLSFLYEKEDKNILQRVNTRTCWGWKNVTSANDQEGLGCADVSNTYYCPVAKYKDFWSKKAALDDVQPYNSWKNCWLLVVVICFLSLVFFFINALIHNVKAGKGIAYRGPEDEFDRHANEAELEAADKEGYGKKNETPYDPLLDKGPDNQMHK